MNRISLTRHLVEIHRSKGLVPTALQQLLETVAQTCTQISQSVGRGALSDVLGEAGSDNVQGEHQKKLDIIANDALLDANVWGGSLAAMASEEMNHPFFIPNHYPTGEYLLLFDPLDGSSNIDVNVAVGSIFSVLRGPDDGRDVQESDFLQSGTRQVAAGYAIYGPSTMLVLTLGNGVQGFTLDPILC